MFSKVRRVNSSNPKGIDTRMEGGIWEAVAVTSAESELYSSWEALRAEVSNKRSEEGKTEKAGIG